ncbi:MAG TPA: PQQ-binding-like beta-propeller repeat protein [Streptosporangiaceae bacterium]|nr:PQQ-binding-like beta-propeller repeat protein [Streptosporangiaceae bacterium]
MSKVTQARPTLAAVAAGAALAGALAMGGPASAAAHPGPGHGRRAATPVFTDWPMFRANPSHTGVSPETAISTTTASSLAPTWTASIGGPSSASPAVATSTTLGKTLVYAESGDHFSAYPVGGGPAVWTYTVKKGGVETSPAVFHGVVYFGSTVGTLYALNAATGAVMCTFDAGGNIAASPVVVEAADGPVVYDGTFPGNGAPGAEWAIHGPGSTAGGCTADWEFTRFAVAQGGTWSSPAYDTDARGVPLVVFGSKDRDDSVYALNARTGALVWRYRTSSAVLADVGAPPTISAPGQNGFAGGVVYVTGKDNVVYALNLTTGRLIWKYSLAAGIGDLAGAALDGSRVYVGSDNGIYALNAITGKLVWHVLAAATFYGSPAVTGPPGRQVLIDAGKAGKLYVLNLATGAVLWSRQLTQQIWGSPTVSHGAIYLDGRDGVLRSFAPKA